MYIKTPPGWRLGQTLFNFLEWLAKNGGHIGQAGERCADPFNTSDTELMAKFEQFLKEVQPR